MQKIQEIQVPWEKPMKKEIATHSSIFAWKIPQTEPGGLQFMGSQRVRHNWAHMHKEKEYII